MPPPLVAVPAARLAPGRIVGWTPGGVAVPTPYIEALWRAGARVVLIVPGDPGTPPPWDGLLLAGGGDIDPARYRAGAHPKVSGVDADRDELELGLARRALDAGTPLLAICRGVQVLNVATGGTLHPHLPDVEGLATHADAGLEPAHDVRARPDSLLATACGTRLAACPSQHHQGLDRLGQGLVATGWADDGLVEAVEVAGGGGWAVGVQWHPERAADVEPAQQALFDAFVAAAAARGAGTAGLGRAGTAWSGRAGGGAASGA